MVACNRVGDDIVAIDGWNLPDTRGNRRDTLQDVTLYTSSYDAANTRLSCTYAIVTIYTPWGMITQTIKKFQLIF